jgi:Cu-Zn family superoxide dismutase
MKKIVILIFALAFIVSCKKEKKEVVSETKTENTVPKDMPKDYNNNMKMGEKKVAVAMNAKSGSNVSGNAIFTENDGVVKMVAIFSGLSEGNHAIHLHEKADCASDDGKSSGGHWNPTAQPHGKWGNDTGYHKGDIGNFSVDAKGNGTVRFSTSEWCIGCGDDKKDIIGKAIIVHQGTDDLTSQPSGAAGKRVSCGGVIQ